MNKVNSATEKSSFKFQLLLAAAVVGVLWLSFGINYFFDLGWNNFGVHPKHVDGVIGIFAYPFLHGSLEHLLSNSLPVLMLLTGMFVFHRKISPKILLYLYIISGSLLWLIGESGSNHIGASGMVYGMAFFLFTGGVRMGDRNSIALSFFIILWYGSMIWGIFPFGVEPGTSWEGHLAGAATGFALALLYVEKKIQKTATEEIDERPFFEKHPLD